VRLAITASAVAVSATLCGISARGADLATDATPSGHLFFAEAILHAKPGQDAALLKQLKDVQRGTRAEPGNLVYDIHHSVDDPLLFVVFEAFVDRAAFDRHRREPHTLEFSQRGAFETLAKPEFDRIYMTPIGNTVVDDPAHDGAAMSELGRANQGQ
jgi:quinol monooxygenase YgiN